MRITYYLSIDVPDDVPPEIQEVIVQDAEPHDRTWQAKVERWLGSEISEAEQALADALPDGWSARIDSAPGVTVKS